MTNERNPDIDLLTQANYVRERARLEKLFFKTYKVSPEDIDQAIRAGIIRESGLVDEWIALYDLGPFIEDE